jgi:hypothetical protein
MRMSNLNPNSASLARPASARAQSLGDALRLQMLDDLIRRRVGEKAQVLAARSLVVCGEPIFLARGNWPQVDLLAAESHRGPRRLPRRWRDVLARHAEPPLVPTGSDLEVGDLDDRWSSAPTVSGMAAFLLAYVRIAPPFARAYSDVILRRAETTAGG